MFGNKTRHQQREKKCEQQKKKMCIFCTSRSQHVSTVIDEVTLAIILKTSGSFPAVMAPPLHRHRRNPPSHQQPISQPAAPGHHNEASSFIQPGRGGEV